MTSIATKKVIEKSRDGICAMVNDLRSTTLPSILQDQRSQINLLKAKLEAMKVTNIHLG